MNSQTQKTYPSLDADIQTDVLIIGGGLTGACLAYFFTEAGFDTVLTEEKKLGNRNTMMDSGIIQRMPPSTVNRRKISSEAPDFLSSFYRDLFQNFQEISESLSENADCLHKNHLLYSDTITGINDLTLEYLSRREKGIACSLVESFPNLSIKTGIFQEHAAGILPAVPFLHHLIDRASERGLQIFEDTGILRFQNTAEHCICQTSHHNLITSKVVVCATGSEIEHFTDRKFGQKTYVCQLLSEPLENLTEQWKQTVFQNIRTNTRFYVNENQQILLEAVGNSRNILSKSERLEHFLRELTGKPQKTVRRTIFKTTETRDFLPVIGADPINPSLLYALSYGINGVLSALYAGKALCSFYQGNYPKAFPFLSPGRSSL